VQSFIRLASHHSIAFGPLNWRAAASAWPLFPSRFPGASIAIALGRSICGPPPAPWRRSGLKPSRPSHADQPKQFEFALCLLRLQHGFLRACACAASSACCSFCLPGSRPSRCFLAACCRASSALRWRSGFLVPFALQSGPRLHEISADLVARLTMRSPTTAKSSAAGLVAAFFQQPYVQTATGSPTQTARHCNAWVGMLSWLFLLSRLSRRFCRFRAIRWFSSE